MHKLTNISLAVAACVLCTQAQAIELVKSGDTTLSVGGYVKAEGIFASPDKGDSDFEGNARESRINFTTTTLVDDKKIKGFIEGDFYGDYASGGSNLRLRHAYMQVDNVMVGKTWSGQFFAVAPRLTEQFDFWGTGFGTIAGSGMHARPDLTLHYANKGLRLTAQDPVYEDADLPDMVASYSDDISNLGYTLAVTAREAGTGIGNDLDSDLGLGVSLAGKLTLGEGSLHGSVYTGKGMGVYSGVCTTGALTPVSRNCDAEDGELVSQTGFSVGYRHVFSPKLRGNMRYGEVNVNNEADTSIDIKSANLIYTYLPNLDLGVEWRDRSDTTLPWRQAGQEVEVMAKYTF
ncbi:hypothetical protein [Psychrobacter maritimus]|uniref:hypothetical protein n=1 Tax=Psychrobacter maritimus TaxID=256325 RepID=UPI003FD25262